MKPTAKPLLIIICIVTGVFLLGCTPFASNKSESLSSQSTSSSNNGPGESKVYSILDYGAKCDGVTDDGAAFASLDSEIVDRRSAQGAILLPSGTCVIGPKFNRTALYRPVNFLMGGSLLIASGLTISLTEPPIAPQNRRIFLGNGKVTFGRIGREVFIEWWGGKADNVTDNSPAMQSAIQALSTFGGVIKALPGDYKFSCDNADGINLGTPAAIGLAGSGQQKTFFRPMTDCGHSLLNISSVNQSGHIRDLTITGDQLLNAASSVFKWTALRCERCGSNDFSNLTLAFAKVGMQVDFLMDGTIQNLNIQNVSDVCMKLGGSTQLDPGHQYVSVDQIHDIVCRPATTGLGLNMDSGISEISLRNLDIAPYSTGSGSSMKGGILIQNSIAGGLRPEGMRFNQTKVSSGADFNLKLTAAINIEFHGSDFGATTAGPNIWLSSQTYNDDVEGFKFVDGKIQNAKQEDVRVSSGCNVRILSSQLGGGGSSAGTYANIHAQANACGLLEIRNNVINAKTSAGAAGQVVGSAVQMDSGSLSDFSVARYGTSYPFVIKGGVAISGNKAGGVRPGGIVDHSSTPVGAKKLSNNQL